ncbi:cation transporter [Petrotoga miotherma DSM 10691]|uniref:Cation transporter n=2 Tax=Petrotoga TaxID=28236 RepID=A0A2K1PG34_9BACT|nr:MULTISPECIES: cation diffusion facilitator family transporter [Petrotoga]MDN5346098.1 cobalt-zinc-cadmium efflux system protein [Petrotoga sp.]PNS01736.1 cation transporter [Petrotoga miotherma DSM 10691]POZ93646.1 cation transporter [Petrotoga halophila DSM 16923]
MDLHHEEKERTLDSRLLLSVILNFGITIAEILGGIFSNSLALLSDAIHNLNDTTAILISYIARVLSKKKRDSKRTYGYKRVETLAAFVNTEILMVIAVYLLIEGINKLSNPSIIQGNIMLTVAFIGLTGNLTTAYLLHSDSKTNLNVKATFIHILSDTISSIFVIIGAFLIIYQKLYIVDAIFTLMISGYIFIESIPLLKNTINILLQGTPTDIEIGKIKTNLEKFDFVKDVHHIHIWTTDGKDKYMEAHIRLQESFDQNNYKLDDCIDKLNKVLKEEFEISHTTLQFEKNRCLEEKKVT